MDKFDDKYRIESHRFYGWNYSADGFYFITIVIQNREMILGEIREHRMVLSDYGKIVEQEWIKSFEIRNELFLDEFVDMPNHLHGLVILRSNDNVRGTDVETHGRASLPDWASKRITPFQ